MSVLSFAEEKFEVKMYVGEVIDLDSFLIDNQVLSSEEDMSWVTANDRIVDVNASGRVEAKKEGKATIYAKDKKNSSRVAKIKIRVVSMVEHFELKDEEISIKVGEVYNLDYELIPADGQEKVLEEGIEWNSSKNRIVEVSDEGQIVGLKEGTAKIYAKTLDGGNKDYVVINVSGIKTDVIIDDGVEEVQVFVGGQHQFKATSDDKNVTYGVEWSTTLDDILKIDENGIVKGLKAGRAQIKATTKDKNKFDTIMVKVVSMVKAIELSHKEVTFNSIGETIDLDYTLVSAIAGMTPFEDTVKWQSSNSNIASVNSEGVVTAKDKGVARITVTTVDGEIEAYCSITVNVAADKEKEVFVGRVYLEDPKDALFVGEKYELPIVLEPADATERDLKFRTKIGSSSQIKEEDGIYYFTPKERGKNKITIITESEKEYIYNIEVISPIKGVEINKEHLQYDNGYYYLYVGQKILIEPKFQVNKNYSEENIYERSVTWDLDKDDYLDIEKEKNDDGDKVTEIYHLVGVEKGTATLTVKSKDGDYEDEIKIKVVSPYKKLSLVDQVTLPINTELVPDVAVIMKEDLKYDLVNGVNFELDKEVVISGQFARIETINAEIGLEKEAILDLQKARLTMIMLQLFIQKLMNTNQDCLN